MGLTPKQKEELNLAIYEYLIKNKFLHSAEYFATEANLQGVSQDSSGGTEINTRGTGSSMKDILENKWTAVVKMKRQVMELEKQNKQLRESAICERCGGGGI